MLQLWVLILVVGGVHPFSSSLQDREKVLQLMNDDRRKQKQGKNNDKRELEQFVTCRSIDPVLQNVIKMHRMANLKRTSHFHSV